MNKCTGRWIDLLVLLVYILISLAMSYPLPLHMTTHVAGRHMDTRIFQWNNWWVKQALLNGLAPQHTDYMYYPSGVSLTGHNINWVSSVLSIPLSFLFGAAAAYNLTFLLTLVLSACGMYALVYYLTGRRDAAFIAGLVYAFFPYRLAGNWDGQMNLANIQWLPLFVLFMLRTVDGKRLFGSRVFDALLAGAFLALASLDCWFFMVFLGMWLALFLPYSLLFERQKWSVRTLAMCLLAALTFTLLVAPLLAPVLAESGQGTTEGALDYYEDQKSTDLLAFLVPSRDHPLLSRPFAQAYERFTHWRPAFLGYSVLALALYAALALRRKSLLWSVSGLLFAALSLGTVLRVNGVEYPRLPTPYGLLSTWFPTFKLVRQANRFEVMVGLAVAVLAGLACADLFRRLEQRSTGRLSWMRYAAPLLTSIVVLFEYMAVPCPLLPQQVSPFYQELAREEGDFAILELPLELLYSRRSIYAQTFHGKKLVNGYVARAATDAEAFVYSSPLIKALRLRTVPDPTLHDVLAQMELLAANNIRYVVIHKSPLPPHPAVEEHVLAAWRELFGPHPFYEDPEILVYRIEPGTSQAAPPLFRFADQLALNAVQAQRTRLLDRQFLSVDLTWKAQRSLDRPYHCTLTLAGSAGEAAVSQSWEISPHFPTSRWRAGVVVAERYVLPIEPSLPAGDYRLSVRVSDASTGGELGTFDSPVQMSGEAQPFVPAVDQIPHTVDATFGDQLWLLGYDGRQEGRRLVLDMYWQALQAMPTNYKIFVHLIRPGDGAVVAQQDTMPRGWSYPTSLWDRYEVFIDRLDLDLEGVEPGEYQLAAGVYRPETGRLPALDAADQPVPDDRVWMGTITVE